jgi:hypothetical protein
MIENILLFINLIYLNLSKYNISNNFKILDQKIGFSTNSIEISIVFFINKFFIFIILLKTTFLLKYI